MRTPFIDIRWLQFPQAPVLRVQHFGHALLLLMSGVLWLFGQYGALKPVLQWQWIDIVGEGGMALMLGVWLTQVRASRPAGIVTNWLCLGLATMVLGAWVDWMDEFWALPKAVLWDNWMESTLTPLGVALLTWGLHLWRQEQLVLNEQLRQRERVFREHRSMDGVTQLGDASYMAQQVEMERCAGRPGALVMLGFDGFDAVLRAHGLAQAERLLQCAGQLLLLNLPHNALLCRYGADRFVVLLPDCAQEHARLIEADLRLALSSFVFHTSQGGLRIKLPVAAASCSTESQEAPHDVMIGLLGRLWT
jgi:GGDEF domain-containing protein